MQYTISLSADGTFIILKYVGDITRKSVVAPTIEAHALGNEMKIDRFLVDATEATNVETVLENYEFVNLDLPTMPLDKFARIALLVRPDDHSHDFVVTAARNSHVAITLFVDRELAERHLHK